MSLDTNYAHGHHAERVAADYLRAHDYTITDMNWKTAWCEIDIIAQKAATIYFVEVKYRMNTTFGNGLDYITDRKLTQMTRAAESWIQMHDGDMDYQLAVIEVSGDDYVITEFITDI